jgi:hypothetical protein
MFRLLFCSFCRRRDSEAASVLLEDLTALEPLLDEPR